MKKILILLMISLQVKSQISFSEFPKNLQLFPRNSENRATVSFKGNVSSTAIRKVSLVVRKDNELFAYQKQTIPTDLALLPFNFEFETQIVALPVEYSFKVFTHNPNGDSVEVLSRERIVCGDIFVLYGQSNIVALIETEKVNAEIDDRLLRNFDFAANHIPTTLQWFPAKKPYAQVGGIGLKLQKLILNKYGIPTCIINGGIGGQAISVLNNRNATNHFDINTPYGRLILRVKEAGGIGKVKGILWRQGENEACSWDVDLNNYPSNFTKLTHFLAEDLQDFQKFYNIQIGIYTCSYTGGGKLREFQRKTKYLYPKTETYTALGIASDDGFHHTKAGYEQITTELFRMIDRDLYGSTDLAEIHPPDIQKIIRKPNKDTLVLIFEKDQNMIYPTDTSINMYFWSLKKYFYGNTEELIVENAWAEKNSIFLKLKVPSISNSLTYLPSNHTPIYNGTHLQNSRGLRAFSFYEFPISDQLEAPNINSIEKISKNQLKISFQNILPDSKIIIERRKTNEAQFREIGMSIQGFFIDTLDFRQTETFLYRIKIETSTSESTYSNVAMFQLTDRDDDLH